MPEQPLTYEEAANLAAYFESVNLEVERILSDTSDIPIGNEYCWMHQPGGWCCPTCYREASK